jgi:hypothetical protein
LFMIVNVHESDKINKNRRTILHNEPDSIKKKINWLSE